MQSEIVIKSVNRGDALICAAILNETEEEKKNSSGISISLLPSGSIYGILIELLRTQGGIQLGVS